METMNKMNPSHFLLPGCMFIGMGIGFIINIVPVGIMIGMGVRFIATAIYKMYAFKTEKHGKEI